MLYARFSKSSIKFLSSNKFSEHTSSSAGDDQLDPVHCFPKSISFLLKKNIQTLKTLSYCQFHFQTRDLKPFFNLN